MNTGNGKKIIIICIVCALLGGAVIGGLGVMIYTELSKTEDSASNTKTGAEDPAEIESLADGAPYDFEAAGYIKLGEYKGLEAEVEPEADDIYAGMMMTAEEAEVDEGDGLVKKGDLVNIDFTGELNGKELEEASGEEEYLIVGKGEYIDDFEKGIIGIKKGKKKTIDCTFPADYDDEELAGKTVKFTITVNDRFGDNTAEAVSDGEYKTVQEYYAYEEKTQREDNIANKGDLVWDAFKEECELNSVPETMLARAEEDITKMYTSFAELSGTTVEELLAEFGMDENGISEMASDTVADYMISKTIVAKEGLTMDDAYYQEALWTALGYEDGDDEITLEKMVEEYKANQGSRPKDDMLIEFVRDYVGEQAVEG